MRIKVTYHVIEMVMESCLFFFFGISIERTLVKILRTSIAIIFFYSMMIFKSPICIYLFIYLFIVSVI